MWILMSPEIIEMKVVRYNIILIVEMFLLFLFFFAC